MKDDADLTNMSLEEGKAYIFSFLTHFKLLQTELKKIAEDKILWEKRIALADSKGLNDLKTQAIAELAKHLNKESERKAEEAELKTTIRKLKENLTGLKARERSVNADALLAMLEIDAYRVDGKETAELDKEFENLEKSGATK